MNEPMSRTDFRDSEPEMGIPCDPTVDRRATPASPPMGAETEGSHAPPGRPAHDADANADANGGTVSPPGSSARRRDVVVASEGTEIMHEPEQNDELYVWASAGTEITLKFPGRAGTHDGEDMRKSDGIPWFPMTVRSGDARTIACTVEVPLPPSTPGSRPGDVETQTVSFTVRPRSTAISGGLRPDLRDRP